MVSEKLELSCICMLNPSSKTGDSFRYIFDFSEIYSWAYCQLWLIIAHVFSSCAAAGKVSFKNLILVTVMLSVCRVCVCERERERERTNDLVNVIDREMIRYHCRPGEGLFHRRSVLPCRALQIINAAHWSVECGLLARGVNLWTGYGWLLIVMLYCNAPAFSVLILLFN